MKKLNVIIVSIILSAGISGAQQPGKVILNAPTNYLIGLNHDITTVVESTILNVMILKQSYPGLDYSHLCEKLDELAIKGQNKEIRIKAFIATNYLKDPDQFNWIEAGTFPKAADLVDKYFSERKQAISEINNEVKS